MEAVNKETKASYQPLSNLDDGEELSASKNARLLPRLSPQCFLSCNVAILLLNVSLIIVLMSWALTKNASRATDCMLPPTPNEKLLQRQQRTFTLSSAWSGAPRNETDQAWKSLVEDDMGAFSISGKLFQQVNPSLETGVRVPYEPEDKYVATFDVVHKLHCLRRPQHFDVQLGQRRANAKAEFQDGAYMPELGSRGGVGKRELCGTFDEIY
ncbi:hypothetical protein BCON_0007g00410 [Botryotinia convoluta]|uniref:Uncharacterized protein n=1 Tax=Botryotinia convoluta TaxID=54673 RepID=A0A4Z1ISC0_9HELO|nr:hypothetical protein BCON_0007g00410 [Botryotinia convoluta]